MMELMHDGGQGYLAGAPIFRMIGLPERSDFCETVLKRMLMRLDDDRFRKLHNLVGEGDGYRSRYYARSEAVYLLKFACHVAAYFHRHGGAKGKTYACEVMKKAEAFLDAEMDKKFGLKIEHDCYVYDGRYYSCFAEYDRASIGMGLPYPSKYTAKLLPHVLLVAQHAITNNGWYDKDCAGEEGGCHVWYGGLYALEALQPIHECISTLKDKAEHADIVAALPTLEKAIKAMMFFLTNSNGSMTGIWHYGPTDMGECANGSFEQVLSDYLRLFGPDKSVERYYWQLPLGIGCYVGRRQSGNTYFMQYIHSMSACATYLAHSPEYLCASKRVSG